MPRPISFILNEALKYVYLDSFSPDIGRSVERATVYPARSVVRLLTSISITRLNLEFLSESSSSPIGNTERLSLSIRLSSFP